MFKKIRADMSKIDSKPRVDSPYIKRSQTSSERKVNKVKKVETVSRTATEFDVTPAVNDHTEYESLSKVVKQLKGESCLSYIDESIITNIIRDSKKNKDLKKIVDYFFKSRP